jgi:NhaP-type Na+/H+ and K+/H+ antiporter
LPHQRLSEIDESHLVMVRCQKGIRLQFESMAHDPDEMVYAIFFLVSPEDKPGTHLRILANIANLIDQKTFMARWRHAHDEQELKEALLRHERYLSLLLRTDNATSVFVGKALRELNLPQGNLIALIHRNGESIVPHGNTELLAGDRITILGDAEGIHELFERYRR